MSSLGRPGLRLRPAAEWHMTCDIRRRIGNMATKATLMKMLQESRGYEQITNRRPTPRPIVLYLMELRTQAAHFNAPKERLAITAEWQNANETPSPVKIHHILPGEGVLPVVFG
jgi:hypothetical protein